MTVYIDAVVKHMSGLRGTFQIVELLDEEGDDLTHHLDQRSRLYTIEQLKEGLEKKFKTDVCIEMIENGLTSR
jgi:hypothetical protein